MNVWNDVEPCTLQPFLQVRNVFPTKVLSVNLGTACDSRRPISTILPASDERASQFLISPLRNVLSMLPEGFTKRLADLAVQKYQQFLRFCSCAGMEASKNLSMFVPNFFDEDKTDKTFPKRSLWQCIRLDRSDSIWQRFSKKFPSMDPNDLNDKLLGAGEGTTWNKAYPRVEFDPEVSSLLCLYMQIRDIPQNSLAYCFCTWSIFHTISYIRVLN